MQSLLILILAVFVLCWPSVLWLLLTRFGVFAGYPTAENIVFALVVVLQLIMWVKGAAAALALISADQTVKNWHRRPYN